MLNLWGAMNNKIYLTYSIVFQCLHSTAEESALSGNHMILCGVQSSIIDVATILGNKIGLFPWDSSRITMELNLFHGIHMDCSTESMWNSCGIHMEWIIS